ncbi:MAG: SCO1664 family protein [Candidatus Rokuibacteriota bacterium]
MPGPDSRDLLARGEIRVKGRLPGSSNTTLLVELALERATTLAVYKPRRGERPLWDFPPGLFRREVAAYLLSEALGWALVPATVRREGPLGEGSLQFFVTADFQQHYFTLHQDPAHHDALKRICVFDLVANNTDRKSGHCLLGLDGHIYAIDNALTFHADFKLRTVIWDFGGQPIPGPILDDVARLAAGGLPDPLARLLAPAERDALLARAGAVLAKGRFPVAHGGHRYPWPLV